ncbi:MAG: class I SAM-dependent DNA methyltransferase [Cytophagaceae bacterium]
MKDNFKTYSKYYNLLYGDKNYSEETEYVCALIKKYNPGIKSILEFGSGTGIHGRLLTAKGFEVLGLERSEGMVEEATRNGFPCEVADISNFHLDKTFDGIVSLFHVISYLTDNNSLLSTFKNANMHLNKGGLFIFDVWYSPAVYEQKAVARIKRMENGQMKAIRFAEPHNHVNRNVIDVKFTVFIKDLESGQEQEIEELHPMRHFSIPEIDLLAETTGFKVITAEEFITHKQPSQSTWGVCFVLEKKKDL